MSTRDQTIIALAGRRIDAPDTQPPRFPVTHAAAVKSAVAELLVLERALTLVCSAACGADILALEAATELGVRTRIVLPFAAERFRTTSVVDRGDDWGPRFDRLIAAARQRADVVDLQRSADGSRAAQAAYDAATRAIFDETIALAASASATAVAVSVWDGQPRPTGDATQDFIECAQQLGMPVRSIATLR